MAGRPINRLTPMGVKNLKEPGMHADGAGLYLVVEVGGAKRWSFVFQWHKRRAEMGLGSTAVVTLKEARDERDRARKLVAQGKNPINERRRERDESREVPSFGAYAAVVVAGLTLNNEKHRDQWLKTLTDYAPTLQKLPVNEIDTQDVLAALKPHWTTIPETADRMRGRIERVLDAARAAGYIASPWENPARWKGHLALLLPRQQVAVQHHEALPYEDMAQFMANLRTRPGLGAKALEWTILTAARTKETRGATWGEIDLEAKVWTVPKERMKGPVEKRREHRVPLSQAALAVLEQMKPLEQPAADQLIFPGRNGQFSNMTMDKILRLMELDVTVHGFRSTFKDWAEDTTNFANGVIEAALAHAVGDETERAYRRGDALLKRRRLMDAWAGYCARKVGSNVTTLSRAAT